MRAVRQPSFGEHVGSTFALGSWDPRLHNFKGPAKIFCIYIFVE